MLVDPVGAHAAGLYLGFQAPQPPLALDAPVLQALGAGVLVDRSGTRLSAQDYLDGTVRRVPRGTCLAHVIAASAGDPVSQIVCSPHVIGGPVL